MQQNDDERPQQKQPIDMTSDELLDYSLAPELAEQVKRLVKPQDDPADCEEPEG
jgi:hypothetical protein